MCGTVSHIVHFQLMLVFDSIYVHHVIDLNFVLGSACYRAHFVYHGHSYFASTVFTSSLAGRSDIFAKEGNILREAPVFY